MGYGQIEGAIPGDCMAPQNWAWWTEHTQWEAGAVARGRANWQRPKMTPTVRPPFGTMPRPQSLRRHAEEMAAATAALTASAAPSSQGTILGSSRVSSAAATSAAAASPRMRSVSLTPLATPRTLQQLNDARAEIGRLAELKSAREEIAALRAALAQSGVAAALPPGPPPGSSSRRLLSAVSSHQAQVVQLPPQPPVVKPVTAVSLPDVGTAPALPPRRERRVTIRDPEGGRKAAAERRKAGAAALASMLKRKHEEDEVRKKSLLNLPMTVAASPRWNKNSQWHGRTRKPWSEGVSRRPELG